MDFNLIHDSTSEIIHAVTESGLFEFTLCGVNGLYLVADDKHLKIYRQIKVNKENCLIHKILLKENGINL